VTHRTPSTPGASAGSRATVSEGLCTMTVHPALFVVAVIGALVWPTAVNADAPGCTQAYEKAQESMANGHLKEALAGLHLCVDSSCPRFIRDDCARWLDRTEAALPTLVFAVLRDGKDQVQAEVLCDGDFLASSLDGKAIPIDPGLHTFSVRISGFEPVERKLLVREGERNRKIEVEFHSPASEAKPSVAAPSALLQEDGGLENREYLTYGLSGLGILGVAGFALFAVLGSNEQGDLEHSCAPYCQTSQVDAVKTKYLIADTCLGAGLVSLAAASYLYFTRHDEKGQRRGNSSGISVGLAPRQAGAALRISTPF
jgi:hypothetical protein